MASTTQTPKQEGNAATKRPPIEKQFVGLYQSVIPEVPDHDVSSDSEGEGYLAAKVRRTAAWLAANDGNLTADSVAAFIENEEANHTDELIAEIESLALMTNDPETKLELTEMVESLRVPAKTRSNA